MIFFSITASFFLPSTNKQECSKLYNAYKIFIREPSSFKDSPWFLN